MTTPVASSWKAPSWTFRAFILAFVPPFFTLCAATPPADPRVFLNTYCVTCHNQKLHTARLALDTLDLARSSATAPILERIIAKLRAGSMPPPGLPRPDPATFRSVAIALENQIDQAWLTAPNPGRVSAVHRLNRAEYQNAIRD